MIRAQSGGAVRAGVRRAALMARRAVLGTRRLYWYDAANFGDRVGPFLFRQITGLEPVLTLPAQTPWNAVYVTVGSVAHEIRANTIVWGTGIIERRTRFPRPLMTTAVRGPLTRGRFLELGHPCPEVFGDPALLLPQFLPAAGVIDYEVGVVPHYVDHDACGRAAATGSRCR